MKTKLIGDVCLYGRDSFGWLATLAGGKGETSRMFGDGELRHGSLTDAVYRACEALVAAGGDVEGFVTVFAPGGDLCALARVSRPGYFGDLHWVAAPRYEIAVEELLAAATKAGGS
jgi:hypothetical protein